MNLSLKAYGTKNGAILWATL